MQMKSQRIQMNVVQRTSLEMERGRGRGRDQEDLIPFVAYKEVLIPFLLPNCCELLT
jgi:hypothetical protein